MGLGFICGSWLHFQLYLRGRKITTQESGSDSCANNTPSSRCDCHPVALTVAFPPVKVGQGAHVASSHTLHSPTANPLLRC